jgi:hypothetical protein
MKNSSDSLYTVKLKITETGRKPSILVFRGKELKFISVDFYIDTGLNILIIKKSKLHPCFKINKEKILAIAGIISEKYRKIGQVKIASN